jgi:hypothetical protein
MHKGGKGMIHDFSFVSVVTFVFEDILILSHLKG